MWFASRYDARYKIVVTRGCLLRITDGKEEIGKKGSGGYYRLHFAGTTRCVHSIMWAEANGRWPKKGYNIGHMDDDPANNASANLREMTSSENNKMAVKNRDYVKILKACRTAIKVVAKNLETGASKQSRSLSAASKELSINAGLISVLLRGVGHTARSKKNKVKYTFNYAGAKDGAGRSSQQTKARRKSVPLAGIPAPKA